MRWSLLFALAVLSAGLAPRSAAAFVPVKATYHGLFFEPDDYWQQSAGTLRLSSTARGHYSARLQIGPKRYSFSGQFDSEGRVVRDILRHYQTPLRVAFQVNTNDADLIEGTVSDGTWTADLIADRAVFNGKTSVCSDQGRYTVVLFGDYASTNFASGHSYGTIKVDKSGRLRFAGSLADGTKVSQSANVSKGGQWPFFLPLYRGGGALFQWLLFNASTNDYLTGDVIWIRPEMSWTRYYPGGFGVKLEATGSDYVRPSKGARILDVTGGEVQFNGGNLYASFTNQVTLDTKNRITNYGANGLKMKFSLSNGTFSGRVMDPITWEWFSFKGVVLQRYAVAAGYFLGWDESGEVWFENPASEAVSPP